MSLNQKKCLVTGASSGIGRAMAIDLAARGCELFLLARRADKLRELEAELKKTSPDLKITLIVADVNTPEIAQILSTKTHEKIDILINNAGLALGRDKVENSDFSDWDQMISTNITANFRVAHTIVPWMLRNGGGDIINLCSIAGHLTYPGGAIYCATKHAVSAFTKVLREETCGRNLRVMQISPGMVETDFSKVRFRGDEKLADAVYAQMTPLSAQDISRMMIFMLEQPRHVVIDEIITMPMAQGSPTTVHRGPA